MADREHDYSAFDAATLTDLANLLWMRHFDPDAVPEKVVDHFTSVKNSPAASGERMGRFLHHLIDHPVARTRDVSKMYEAMLPFCDALSPLQTYVMRNLLGKSANEGYDTVPDTVELQFPRDHEVKLTAQTGWHFIVGSCWDADGRQYGIELMFFGEALYPPAQAASYGLTDLENQLIEIQFAISEEGARHHQGAPIVVAGTSGLLETATEPFSFALGRNTMRSVGPDDLFPLRAQAWGVDRGDEPHVELAMDVVFTTHKDYLFQGDEGAMPSVDGVGTFYYSAPNIQIDPDASTLRIGDREVRLVRGEFWFDHQWGYLAGNPRSTVMRAADNVAPPEPEGWDWFMAQFVGNRQLTVVGPHKKTYAEVYYHQTGPTPPPTMEVRVGGKFMEADNTTSTVWGTLQIDEWIKTEHSPDPIRYPATHTWHPNHWRFAFDDLPADIATFTMTPIVTGGQSAFFANGAQICEGAVRLADAEGNHIGNGFAESVAFADCKRNQLRLAGVPDTDEMLELVEAKAPPLGTRLRNAFYVVRHHKALEERLASAKGMEFFFDAGTGDGGSEDGGSGDGASAADAGAQ